MNREELSCPYCTKPFWYQKSSNTTGLFFVKAKEPAPLTYNQLQDQLDEANYKIEMLRLNGVHTCHDQCPRPMCSMRRELDEARAEIASLKDDLKTVRSSYKLRNMTAITRAERLDKYEAEIVMLRKEIVKRDTWDAFNVDKIKQLEAELAEKNEALEWVIDCDELDLLNLAEDKATEVLAKYKGGENE